MTERICGVCEREVTDAMECDDALCPHLNKVSGLVSVNPNEMPPEVTPNDREALQHEWEQWAQYAESHGSWLQFLQDRGIAA